MKKVPRYIIQASALVVAAFSAVFSLTSLRADVNLSMASLGVVFAAAFTFLNPETTGLMHPLSPWRDALSEAQHAFSMAKHKWLVNLCFALAAYSVIDATLGLFGKSC